MQAFLPSLASSLGLFLPLIVVNCIILGRAEAYASKNKVLPSALDGVVMGLGFTFALVLMGFFRELLGAGTILSGYVNGVNGIAVPFFHSNPMVMMILPVAFTGALFALPLTGRDLSMITLVAIIMLAGTVVNSSIILVEYIRIRRRRGEDRETAILRACPLRVRPVMMTTLTTILAMIPMALAYGDAGEMMQGLALVDVGGLIASTVLALLMLPVYYRLMNRKPKEEPDYD